MDNIQGGGRRFLGYFKRHFGSQISIKQLHIYRLKPKFATKVSLITVDYCVELLLFALVLCKTTLPPATETESGTPIKSLNFEDSFQSVCMNACSTWCQKWDSNPRPNYIL